MDGNRGKRKGKGKGKGGNKKEDRRTPSAKELLLPKKQVIRHSNLPIAEVKDVQQPCPVCPICKEKIEFIEEALTDQDGQYCHFDCVIGKLKEQEHLTASQVISYVGSGSFAVFEKDDAGHYTMVRKIDYEKREAFDAMKKYVEGTKA